MSSVTHRPLLPLLPNAMMQVSTESERNLSVSCLYSLPSAFVHNYQIQDSGSGFFVNAGNTLITGGTFVGLFMCAV